MIRLSASLLLVALCASPAFAQHNWAYRTDRGTPLEPAPDGTPRYREDSGWSTPQFVDSHWGIEYGETLSVNPFTVVLQGDRTSAAFTAAANKLTLDLAGGTYTVIPFIGNGLEGGPITIVDRFETGAYLKIANGTVENSAGGSARLFVGRPGLTGRLFIENAHLKTRYVDIGVQSNGFTTVETGGTLAVQNDLSLGVLGDGLLELRGSGASVSTRILKIGATFGEGVLLMSGEDSLLHVRDAVKIDNPIPGHPDDNIGLVIRQGTAQIDGNLELSGRYSAASIEGGRLVVGDQIKFVASPNATSGGNLYLKSGRIEINDALAFRPTPLNAFYWKEGTVAFNSDEAILTDQQLQNFTRQGAISYGGDRAAGTLAAGQTIESAGRLTVTGDSIGLAGGTIRAGSELVLNADLHGHGTLDALVTGSGGIVNPTANRLSIGALGGTNAISSEGELQVGAKSIDATFAGTSSGAGRFVKLGSATQTITGQIANTGGVEVRQGALRLAGSGPRLDTTTLAVADAAILGVQDGAAGFASSATIGSSSAGPPARLEISGAGSRLSIAGNLSNRGLIDITGGVLEVGGTLINQGTVINNGRLDAAVAGAGLLTGGGTFGGAVTIAAGGMLSPGNSPGTANFVDLTLDAGSSFELELAAATGTAGVDWDLAVVSDLLTITATAADPVTILLKSLDAELQDGALAGFDPSQSWSWQFLAATIPDPQSIDLSIFQINTDAFVDVNELGPGSFRVTAASNGLSVSFSPQPAAVPEPGSALLLCLAGLTAAGLRRGRRKRKAG